MTLPTPLPYHREPESTHTPRSCSGSTSFLASVRLTIVSNDTRLRYLQYDEFHSTRNFRTNLNNFHSRCTERRRERVRRLIFLLFFARRAFSFGIVYVLAGLARIYTNRPRRLRRETGILGMFNRFLWYV